MNWFNCLLQQIMLNVAECSVLLWGTLRGGGGEGVDWGPLVQWRALPDWVWLQICLIMDEVDGMSGGDRGGVTDLIQTIHRSKVPIICICNDKYNQKLRSLRNHTVELDYRCEPPLMHTCAYSLRC